VFTNKVGVPRGTPVTPPFLIGIDPGSDLGLARSFLSARDRMPIVPRTTGGAKAHPAPSTRCLLAIEKSCISQKRPCIPAASPRARLRERERAWRGKMMEDHAQPRPYSSSAFSGAGIRAGRTLEVAEFLDRHQGPVPPRHEFRNAGPLSAAREGGEAWRRIKEQSRSRMCQGHDGQSHGQVPSHREPKDKRLPLIARNIVGRSAAKK